MDWKNLRQGRAQNAQDYTQEFKKRALTLDIPLYTQDIILMFNPTNFDEVCVQATHIESMENNV